MNKKIPLLTIVLFGIVAFCNAQDSTFYLSAWGFYRPGLEQYFSVKDESDNLTLLGVNAIEQDVHDPVFHPKTGQPFGENGWLDSLCEPQNGAFKMYMAFGTRPILAGARVSELFYNWGLDTSNVPVAWEDTLKHLADTIIQTYRDKKGFKGLIMGWEGNYNDSLGVSHWEKWDNRIKYMKYFSQYWDSRAPVNLKRSNLFFFCIKAWNQAEVPFARFVQDFCDENNYCHLGVMENDMYFNYAGLPYSGPVFQNTLQEWMIDGCDTCFKYFEKEHPETKWYSNIYTSREDGYNDTMIWPRYRWPTREEIRVQGWLAISRGAKGISVAQYRSGRQDWDNPHIEYFGPLEINRDPRSKTKYPEIQYTDSARFRVFDWTKELCDTLKVLGPTLMNLRCYDPCRIDKINSSSIIKGITFDSSTPTEIRDIYYESSLFYEIGDSTQKYLMLVNRHCLKTDTATLIVTINYMPSFGQPNSYFIVDVLNNKTITGLMPASKDTCFTVKLLPGGGRLLRIVPFASAPKINNGAIHTNFKFAEITPNVSTPLSQDSIQVTQKYYVKTQADTAANPDYISYYWAADTSDWLPYSASSIKYLENSVDNKANIFELQFKIGGGKILTPKYSAQILFNDVPPVNGAITINNNANFTNSQTVNVKLSGTDLFPGLSQMRFAEKPFGSDSGYVNLVKNGTFADTANWTLDNAEFYDGFLHLKGVHTGPGPAQIGSSAKQIIPGSEINPHRNKLFRLSDDIYSHDVISSYKYVDVFYADSLFPNGVRLLDKPIASTPEVVWKASSDTFTLKVDTARSLDRIEISYNIFGIQLPPPPPDPGTLFNTIAVDNIRLEPVELKTGALPDNVPQNTYVFDGWGYADTNYPLYYKLSPDDGTKRVYMQLKDLPGNISSEPGWYDDIILDMTKPAVSLDIPLDLSYVNGTVPVCGWSADQNFKDWTLDCQPYASDNWQALFTNTTHINVNGPYYSMLLYSWNTDMLSDDIYMLRFTANDLAGNARADTHYVQVLTGPDLPAQAITSEFATFNSLPVDATCDNFGNIYVTDTQADKIWKFSPEGDSLLCFGYKYTCQDTLGLNHPKGIAVDDSGNIWITDCYQSKVKKYDGQGNYLSAIGKYGNQQGEFNQPTGITISGNEIYVVDHLNGRVQVFNKTGAFIRQFGNNYLNQPAGIAIRNNEAEKLVYVCDSQNDRVAIFDTTGNLVNSIDSLGLDKPWDICFDNNNNLYIADVYNNRVIELDPWHNKLLTFGIQGQEAGQFKLPQGLAVSPDGKYLYVADTHNDRLQRFKMFFDMGTLGGAQFAGKRQIANSAPTVFGLSQCYPNPCKQATNINYQIAQPGNVRIKIYNTLGQVVKTLVSENQQPGYYSINWDGRDECTRQVAAGIYFYRLQAGSFSSTKKAVMLR